MPLWPFKKRRSAATNKDTPAPPTIDRTDDNINSFHDFTTPAPRPSTAITQRIRRTSQHTEKVADAGIPAPQQLQRHATPTPGEKHTDHSTAQPRGSVEDITALPTSWNLERSPHLRHIDTGRPQIPYTFRDHSTSQTSVPRTDPRPLSRPATAQSKRSAHGTFSSKKRKDDDRIREEEIRGMSAPINVPKRHGDGVFRRDSKKRRNFSHIKDSNISLPYGESIHSMSTVPEQRGWELGLFDMFSPRPAIRLSGVPQYPAPSPFAQPPMTREYQGGKEKESVDAFKKKKTQKIGETANEMDASDLRVLMERDAKRRERRKREQQEKLDRKLKARAARDRADSNKRLQEAEEARREQEVRLRVEEERRAREPLAPPTAVHPALREEPHLAPGDVIGLGIGTEQQSDEPMQPVEDPFRDPLPSPPPEHEAQPEMRQLDVPGAFTPLETPMEDPIVETAQAVRYSQHTPMMASPPLSPSYNRAPTPSSLLSNTIDRQERTASLPESPPGLSALLEERRTSEPRSIESRRAGGWATLFRRGGTKKEVKPTPASEMSFTNTSRESMSRGPIPAHLVGGDRSPFQRNKTGTPTRTQSKFREDLPEMPVSPPDSRVQSPDVPDLPAGAAAIAASHRGRASPRPIERLNGHSRSSDVDARGAPRFDTPISPSGRGAGLMSASLASVDSEGSWLASGGSLKRGSRSSQLSRSIGSLSKRPQEFVGSYEDLGGQDKDAEYISRRATSADPHKRQSRRRTSTSTITGAEEESIYDETPDISGLSAPLTMHGSVRRKPTLVHRDPIARSREGLLAEYATGEVATIEGIKDDGFEPVTPGTEAQVHRATSVHFGGRGHARKVSAGSAKLLDLPASRRQSLSPVETKRASSASLSKMG